MKRGVHIHISNKLLYTLLAGLFLVSITMVVWAQSNTVSHNSNEVYVDITGEGSMKLQDAIDQGKIGGGSTQCDWSGWTSKNPWEGGVLCESNILKKDYVNGVSKDLWLESGSCETSHAKGYHCRITISTKGSYNLQCWTTGEDHGEWMGTVNGIRQEATGEIYTDNTLLYGPYTGSITNSNPSVRVDYSSSTGKWTLTSKGKENNHNSPLWTTKTCSAGGYK
ncbi:MAG: hypothetical protein ABIH72_00420 [archaeon]